ncbi:CWF19-like protein 2 isoform X1 [Amborella trichopoda]|nr:CWF19-like protein 2 isoform X1 [Amborella trichopoda]XP_020520205.1 CWF19-like protein 2 isoform X1 [Amborella trichopoda]XP_020520206.1 CWF19-like protein 2 isoform X1 [Amborella trichopoda]|eukprot:XP_006838815.2 CWF19-like protein 2 isoform X1 [Amborella trichopoda]
MLSGVKFIPRDHLHNVQEKRDLDSSPKARNKAKKEEKKHRKKKKKSHHDSSSDEERWRKRSRRKKARYSSEESLSSLFGSDGESSSDERENNHKKSRKGSEASEGAYASDDSREILSLEDMGIARKEMGLEWMLRPAQKPDLRPPTKTDSPPDEPDIDEIKKPNPKELNPYLKDNGSGYPDESNMNTKDESLLPPSLVVGDGGASWRLKALKRAQEQADREGRKLDAVIEERWGSAGQMAVSLASTKAAPARAHLHAIKDRKRGIINSSEKVAGDEREESKDYLRDVSSCHPKMKAPKFDDSLSWRKRKGPNMSTKDAKLVSAAASSVNKYANDGRFLAQINQHLSKDIDGGASPSCRLDKANETSEPGMVSNKYDGANGESSVSNQVLSANQLAAKVLQLRMKGKHEEAEKLLKESESTGTTSNREHKAIIQGNATRRRSGDFYARKKREEDADMHLAKRIVQNKQYTTYGQADDEYDFDEAPRKKQKQKGKAALEQKLTEKPSFQKRLGTQQERCHFCFENPDRPKHLVISIANFTYLMLPQWQPVVQGHCCILPMQHEGSTRNLDDDAWNEIRNFKKCLIRMFAEQEKDVIFIETAMGLSQQRRHCMVECIPIPRHIAPEAPMYFKQAIDEAEEEWSQHNAKKLIDTSVKGLRGSIPKNFPYFHVEFGLQRGFVHVIDDEKQFKSNMGLNVIRGMLELPEEDMYRRRQHESVEAQKQAVSRFAREWEPFDWTRALDE